MKARILNLISSADGQRELAKWCLILWTIICAVAMALEVYFAFYDLSDDVGEMARGVASVGQGIIDSSDSTLELAGERFEQDVNEIQQGSTSFALTLWGLIKGIAAWCFLWILVAYPTSHILMLHRRPIRSLSLYEFHGEGNECRFCQELLFGFPKYCPHCGSSLVELPSDRRVSNL